MPTKGIVSSLIPNIAPAREKSRVIATSTTLWYLPTDLMNLPIPTEMAPVLLSSQKEPPTISIKIIIPDCFTNP